MIPRFSTCHVFRTCALLWSSGLWDSPWWWAHYVPLSHLRGRTMEEFMWDSIRILRFNRVSKTPVTRVISSLISLRGSFAGLWRYILVGQFSELSQLIQWYPSLPLLRTKPRLFFRLRFSSFHSRGKFTCSRVRISKLKGIHMIGGFCPTEFFLNIPDQFLQE